MLDLETLGTDSNSVIVSIGAVFFDETNIGSTFYRALNIDAQLGNGKVVNGGTIRWWMQQSEEARAVFKDEGHNIFTVLNDFSFWAIGGSAESRPKPKIWGNGATFDNVLLSNLYKTAGIERPWGYRDDRCYRTAVAGFDYNLPRSGTYHNAADDAVYQVNYLQAAVKAGRCHLS